MHQDAMQRAMPAQRKTPMHQKHTRRFLLINPNTNGLTTRRLLDTLAPHVPSDVKLDVCTARFGSTYIACEASHAVAAHACLDAWAQHLAAVPGPLDGVLIGCFGDPGLFALREVSGAPVTGLAEASFIQAAARGPFAIVTGGERWKAMLTRLAHNLGYGDLLRHVETVAPSGAVLQADPAMAMQCLSQACQQAATTGVASVVLGGAGLAGYAQGLQAHSPLPLIDSALAGLGVLLDGMAPVALSAENGSFAQWTGMPDAFIRMPARSGM
jgi:Asp/Glu/hydantoin racemase